MSVGDEQCAGFFGFFQLWTFSGNQHVGILHMDFSYSFELTMSSHTVDRALNQHQRNRSVYIYSRRPWGGGTLTDDLSTSKILVTVLSSR